MALTGVELLTLDEAAAYLRVHRRTMGRLLRAGTVPGTKIGRQWRIRRADLEAALAAGTAAAPKANGVEPGELSPDAARVRGPHTREGPG